MKNNLAKTAILALVFFLNGMPAFAADIAVVDPWVREGPPTARVLGGFMTITNAAARDDALVSVTSPDFNMVELHQTVMEDGMGKMVAQEKIVVPAGGKVVLKPGSYHLMLMMAKRKFKAGDEIKAELSFESGAVLSVVLPVRKGEGMMDHSHHSHH